YLENRLSLNFSDVQKFEEEYDKLIRFIWDEPEIEVPKLGMKPDFSKSMNLKNKRKLLYLYSFGKQYSPFSSSSTTTGMTLVCLSS
ncbi:hypothetical protein ACW7FY_13965, partial [Bacillus subtilis]